MSNQNEFRAVMQRVFEGNFGPVIDRVFTLDEVRQAEEYLQDASSFGKVLIEIV
jgi:NADPH:quinone reductase-like Zn-dependent oxidoreductase